MATIYGNIEALEEWNNLLRTVEQMWFDLYQKLIISGTQKKINLQRGECINWSPDLISVMKKVTKSAIFKKVGAFIQCVCVAIGVSRPQGT